jgi:hypothetical protein
LLKHFALGIAVAVPGVVALLGYVGVVLVAGVYVQVTEQGAFQRAVVQAVVAAFSTLKAL